MHVVCNIVNDFFNVRTDYDDDEGVTGSAAALDLYIPINETNGFYETPSPNYTHHQTLKLNAHISSA